METRELICINCPLGCGLVVTMEQGTVIKVEEIPVQKEKNMGKRS